MKLLFENWRKYLVEVEWAGFHGKGGRPHQTAPGGRGGGMYQLGCLEDFYDANSGEGTEEEPEPDGEYDVWEKEGDGGCPQFDGGESVTAEDVVKAVRFLNDRKPANLVAYSRGGGVAYLALQSGDLQHIPKVHYVAPAWKKNGSLPPGAHKGGYIIHGTHDVRVPLKHSAELSIATGLPLAVFPRFGHLGDILGVAQNATEAETIVSAEQLKNMPIDLLPDWNKRIQFWKVRPDKDAGIEGEKSEEVLTVEDAQQRWYEEYVLGAANETPV